MIFKKFKLTILFFLLGFHLAQWFVISFVSWYYLLVVTCHNQEQSTHSDLVLTFTCAQCSVLSWHTAWEKRTVSTYSFHDKYCKINSIVTFKKIIILFETIHVLLFLIIHSMVITVGQLQSKNWKSIALW